MTLRRKTRHRESGAVLVEFVMVLPVLFALLLGITTGGHAYSTKLSVVGAVREGARFGSTLQLTSLPSAVADFEASVVNRIVASSGGSLTSAQVCVKLVLPVGGTACGSTDPAGASAQPSVHLVKVSASTNAKLQFFFFTTNPTLSGRLVARYERDTG